MNNTSTRGRKQLCQRVNALALRVSPKMLVLIENLNGDGQNAEANLIGISFEPQGHDYKAYFVVQDIRGNVDEVEPENVSFIDNELLQEFHENNFSQDLDEDEDEEYDDEEDDEDYEDEEDEEEDDDN